MNREEALRFLGLPSDPDAERIQDAYEQYCFEVRQKALMNLATPRTMKKRAEALGQAKRAFSLLTDEEEEELPSIPFEALIKFEDACERLGHPPPWSSCIRSYEQKVGEARLAIANSFSASPLARAISWAVRLQQAYHRILYEAFSPAILHPEAYPASNGSIDKEIKAGQAAYTGTLIRDLESLEMAGIGNNGLHRAADELERLLPRVQEAASRVLTEVQRIHQLVKLDERKA